MMKNKKPPVKPVPYSERGRMVDAVIVFCNSCSEYAIIKPTGSKFNKQTARQVALNNKWRLLNGKWTCHKCAMARTTEVKNAEQ